MLIYTAIIPRNQPFYWDIVGENLDLSCCDPDLLDVAIEAFLQRDVRAFLCTAHDSEQAWQLIDDNLGELQMAGILEASMWFLISSAKPIGREAAPRDTFDSIFLLSSAHHLRSLGHPFPRNEKLKLYRGIAGEDKWRARGYFWTRSLAVACSYAVGGWSKRPMVVQTTIGSGSVYAHFEGRGEAEFVARPARVSRVDLTEEEIAITASLYEETKDIAEDN